MPQRKKKKKKVPAGLNKKEKKNDIPERKKWQAQFNEKMVHEHRPSRTFAAGQFKLGSSFLVTKRPWDSKNCHVFKGINALQETITVKEFVPIFWTRVNEQKEWNNAALTKGRHAFLIKPKIA